MSSTAKVIRVVVAGRDGVRRTIGDALAEAGIEVVARCASREEALTAVDERQPDVCVVDREIDGGGLIATAALASPPRPPRVIVVGGGDAPAERRAADFAGAAGYLPGAPDAARLVAAVRAVAGPRRA
ncbi:MAG: response regulator [Gaiellaceae bacterium]